MEEQGDEHSEEEGQDEDKRASVGIRRTGMSGSETQAKLASLAPQPKHLKEKM